MTRKMSTPTPNATHERVSSTGPVQDHLHLVDLFLYDSSMFANVGIVEARDWTILVDVGTSDSIGAILNYLHFHHIPTRRVLVVPTHHHFDHVGGLGSLVGVLEGGGSEVRVLATPLLEERLADQSAHASAARETFGDIVGRVEPVPESAIEVVPPEHALELAGKDGETWTLELVPTPGHCADHVSPFVTMGDSKVCFFGEALGINLQKDLTPLPASSAPEFDSREYLASIRRVLWREPDVGFFSHFGGIRGSHNVRVAAHNAERMLRSFRRTVTCLYDREGRTRDVIARVVESYSEYVATYALNPALARQLAFTIVYGILLDAGRVHRE
ncbi:MAG: MBL fold metallo-hydrolase [Promethearchaeota archaeon]